MMYRSFLNMDLLPQIEEFDGDYPIIKKQPFLDYPFIGFNEALSSNNVEKNIHFFLHDYQFERCWRDAERYINVLKKYKTVLSPDFSLYLDMPKKLQEFNHYRKQFLGALWQKNGINVIPTICWGDEDTYDFCFKGYEKNSIVAISTLGSKSHKDYFYSGFHEMIYKLSPSKILVYGDIKNMYLGENVINIEIKGGLYGR